MTAPATSILADASIMAATGEAPTVTAAVGQSTLTSIYVVTPTSTMGVGASASVAAASLSGAEARRQVGVAGVLIMAGLAVFGVAGS